MLAGQENRELGDERTLEGLILDGRYRLDERFDEGGVGAVWRATQLAVGRNVVVKVLHRHLRASRESSARFELEARALASMRHPGCVTLFDFGWSDEIDAHYMVMEEIEGVSLARALSRGAPMADALEACAAACSALEHAHKRGVLHRDLKPSNIMLCAYGEPCAKILDFGLARLFNEETLLPRSEPLSMAGRVYGTPAYMSPEQCEGSAVLGPECDVYALGVILYEIFEGELPFPGHSAVGTLLAHVQRGVPRPTNPAISERAKDLVASMTARDRKARMIDLEAIGSALRDEAALLRERSGPMRSLPHASGELEDGAKTLDPSTNSLTRIGAASHRTLVGPPAPTHLATVQSHDQLSALSAPATPGPISSPSPPRSRAPRLLALVALLALAGGALSFHAPWSTTAPQGPLQVAKAVYVPAERAEPLIVPTSVELTPAPRAAARVKREPPPSEERAARRPIREEISRPRRDAAPPPPPKTKRPPTIRLKF